MERQYTCFFTGHRRLPKRKLDYLGKVLEIKIKNLIEDKGVTSFIVGGAVGFDTLAAKTVIRLKNEYPYIKLNLYIPCHGQEKKWPPEAKYEWHMIMSKVDNYRYITEGTYTTGCMQKRNHEMAKDAQYGIAYCVYSKSGTGETMKYADDIGCIVDNIAEDIY